MSMNTAKKFELYSVKNGNIYGIIYSQNSIDKVYLQCRHRSLVLLEKNVLRERKESNLCSFSMVPKLTRFKLGFQTYTWFW